MRSHVHVQRDGARLAPHFAAALDVVLHAIERSTTARVRSGVIVRHQRGKLIITTAAGWRLSACRLGDRIALNVLRGPRLDHGRRAALRDAHDAHEREVDLWLAWALAVVTTTGPRWPALSEFMRARKAA